jgi:hypothetical protein
MPDDKRIEQLSDYVLNTYIDDTTATFPTSTWSEVPSLVRRTNNGPEAFHSHYNEQFYKSHPSMIRRFKKGKSKKMCKPFTDDTSVIFVLFCKTYILYLPPPSLS